MKTLSKLLPIVLILSLFLQCCRDKDKDCYDPTNPKCVNYNPCHNAKLPDADFTIQENLLISYPGPTRWQWMPDDTVFVGRSNIKFDSPYNGVEYKHTLYLGAETIEGNTFTRDFSSVSTEQRPYKVTITHVIEYSIDTECFPNTVGRDSITKTITLVRYMNDLRTYGAYRGVFENQKDSFDFTVLIEDSFGNPVDWGSQDTQWKIINFHNQGDTLNEPFILRNTVLSFLNDFGGMIPIGLLELEPNSNKFIFEYRYLNEKHIVKGRKLE